MKRHHHRQQLNRPMAIGLVTLVAASGLKYFLDSRLGAEAESFDMVLGLLYGVCIGAMLLGIRTQVRSNACADREGLSASGHS